MADSARQGHRAVMPEHVAIKGIECGVVDVRGENAFAQIIEDNHASDTTEPAKGFLVQLCPWPQWSPQIRPMAVTSKPANEKAVRTSHSFTLPG
jgi:hypothetical protein